MVEYSAKRRKDSSHWPFLFVTACLVAIGLVFIYSSSSVFALEKHGQASFFVYRQLFGLVLGLIGFGIAFLFPTKLVRILSPYIYFLTLGMTTLTLLPSFALRMHGSSRWLKLFGIGLQPSEFLKLAFILYVAYLLQQKKYQRQSFWGSFVPLTVIFGVTALVLLKQPDFGLTVVLSATLFMVLLIAQFSGEYLFAAAGMLVPAGGLLIWFKPYRLRRILTFLNPWDDPQGAGFQIIQSLIAVGSGGLWGVGISHSKQKFFYLPMQHTDFIFAIIAEEVGFIGSVVLISLYVMWLYFGMRLAWSMRSEFATYATLGFVILISLQALINLCVVTGLFPTKGVGLPFVSYGCSGLVSNLIMIGVIMRCSKNN
jgi:cell division protein FtsW